jgi:hypothetical protein
MRTGQLCTALQLALSVCLSGAGLHAEDCPELLSTIPGVNAATVAAWGSYAYVGGIDVGGQASLRVVDVTDPTLPVVVGVVPIAEPIGDIAVSSRYAYLAAGGLRVVDVSIPESPVEIGFCYTSGCAASVTLSRNCAFVAS